MPSVGSSVLSQFGKGSGTISGFTGPTGPTGSTGPIGPFGAPGPTGSTGSSISGITIVNNIVITTFSNGTTLAATGRAIGNTGPVQYIVDFKNLGTGVSFGYGTTSDGFIVRPIRFVNESSTSTISIDNSDSRFYNITLTNPSVGLTAVSDGTNNIKFLQYNSSNLLEKIPNTSGVTTTTPNTIDRIKFVSANLFERVRGIGWTGSTGAVYFTFDGDTVGCTLNPFVKEYDRHMWGSKSKVFVGDFESYKTKIRIAQCPIDDNVYSFTLLIYNAKNPDILTDRFTSQSVINWQFGAVPCFTWQENSTGSQLGPVDLLINFFGISGTWYAYWRPIRISSPTYNQANELAYFTACKNGTCIGS